MRIIYIVIILLLLTTNVIAFRIARPATFSLPWTQDQVNQLNEAMASLWNVTTGEFNLDIVSTTKTKSSNGDFWIIMTGANSYIQFKAQDHIYTIRGN